MSEKLAFGIYQDENGVPRMECNMPTEFAVRMLAAVLEDLRDKRAVQLFAEMLARKPIISGIK